MKLSDNLLRNLLWMVFSLLITATILGSFTYLYLDSQLPDVQALKEVQLPVPLRVYTSDGQLIAEFGEISRNPVSYNEVPPLLVKAILATEDQRFFEHSGIDVFGLLRATGQLILTGTKSQGGSTITMQVARNFYLTPKKTFIRKITEILLSLKIERELSKEQILELYLNKIYLGNRAYGVDAAAQIYYGKPLKQLTLPELAMIAGLPKAPSTINPLADPIAAKERRDHVLTRMHDLGEIDDKAYQAAINTPLTAAYHGPVIPVRAPYVAEMVRDMMMTSFGDDTYSKGYSVYTTINSQQQQAANQALRNALLTYDRRHGYRGPENNRGAYSNNKIKQKDKLVDMPDINNLRPAAVTSVGNKSVTALLKDGSQITIPWQGLSWANPQQKNGWPGRAPKTASDILKVGDIIRVQQSDNTWQLAQVPQVEGALVALNPQTGAITALVGGFDFRKSKFNRVTQAQRQPGSGFKPFIYAAALAKGFTLASEFNNAPLVFTVPGQDKLWRPQNDDRNFGGPTRLRYALMQSINLVSVRLLQAIGVPYAISYIERFGFEKKQLPENLTLALGTADVTPLQMARGYAVFANGGYRINPFVIDHITNHQDQIIYQAQPKTACVDNCTDANEDSSQGSGQYAPRAIPVQIAFLMTSALQSVTKSGTGFMVDQILGRNDLAGKTGTTNDNVDTWFTGFNSDIVASTWVGFDQPASVHEFGSRAALPMWIDFMKVALAGKPEHTLPIPAGIVTAQIDSVTGLLAPPGDPNAITEYFRNDTVPQQQAAAPVANGAGGNTAGSNEPLF